MSMHDLLSEELEAICRYSQEQYLAERPLSVEELFASETLKMPGI